MKPLISNDTYHDEPAYENGTIVPIANEDSGENLINRCAAQFSVGTETAANILQFYDINFSSNDTMLVGSLSQALSERDRKWWYSIEKIFDLLINYIRKQKNPKMLKMSPSAMALALGFTLSAGAKNPAELARRLGLQRAFGQNGKQTVNKCVQKFIRQLNLAKIPGQRDKLARERMRESRYNQLKPSTNHDNQNQKTSLTSNGNLHREIRPLKQEGNGHLDPRGHQGLRHGHRGNPGGNKKLGPRV